MMHRNDLYMGIDIGKTKIAAAVVDTGGTVVEKQTVRTKYAEGFDEILKQCSEVSGRFIRSHKIKAVGIGTFGIVDSNTGVLLKSSASQNAPNLNIRKIFEEKFGLRTYVCNDVCAGALGEHIFGAGKGTNSSVSIMIGTGVGTGIIINNKILAGEHFLAGQAGWAGILEKSMTWEDFFSGSGIEKRALKYIRKSISAKEVFELAYAGNKLAEGIIEDAVKYAGSYIAFIQHLVDPEIIIMGGSVAINQPRFASDIRRSAMELHDVDDFGVRDALRVVDAKLGNDMGVIGAASLAIQDAQAHLRR